MDEKTKLNELDTIIGDTKEIDVTEDLDKDLQELLDSIDSMPYIEIGGLKQRTENDVIQLQNVKQFVDTVKEIDDPTTRKIAEANILDNVKLQTEINDFNTSYEEDMKKFGIIIDKCTAKLNEIPEEERNKTSFLSNSMVESLKYRIDKIDPNNLNYDYIVKKYNEVIHAFEYRMDHTYLIDRAKSFMSNKKNLKMIKKYLSDNGYAKKVMKPLSVTIRIEIVKDAMEELLDITGSEKSTILFIIFLSKIMEKEKRSGKDSYVKVMILNLADLHNKVFDLSDPDYYREYLKSTLLPIFKID